MYNLFATPGWFNGLDLAFEVVSFVIAMLIAAYSFRAYQLSKENRYGYFALAFAAIALSLLLKIFTSSILYYEPVRDVTAEALLPVMGGTLDFSDLLYRGAFFIQMVAMLGGWLLVFFISQKSRARLSKYYEVSQIALFIYLILLISVIANFKFFVFYLTGAVILSLTVLNYYKNYLNTDQNENAFLVMIAFLFILLANMCYALIFLEGIFYVLAEVLQLVGFLMLLYTYRKVAECGRKMKE